MSIKLVCPDSDAELRELLRAALVRSFTRGQVAILNPADWERDLAEGRYRSSRAFVIANAPESWAKFIIKSLEIPGTKILLLGRIPVSLAKMLNAEVWDFPAEVASSFLCEPAPANEYRQSPAVIHYTEETSLGLSSPIPRRPCLRYDFTDEWNNLGYGAIRTDGSAWSVSQKVKVSPEHNIASLKINGSDISAYSALWNKDSASLLWFNRPVGPIDSQEWRLVEYYFSSYNSAGSICLPVPSEIPSGYNAAVTMRLDCDEDIASAKPLFDLYNSQAIPFSLALHTTIIGEPQHLPLMREVLDKGGALLSHSATHPPAWGGSYTVAIREASASRIAIRNLIGENVRIDYAVSPFHQNPLYSIYAMKDAGLSGFIGGIIRNDPEFLMARGGEVPRGATGFVSHSQQCMFHGDCIPTEGDPLKIYKESFDTAKSSRSLFGYLDHPFSSRYQYGWKSEEQRASIHGDFLKYLKSSGNIIFLSENNAMDWIRRKSILTIRRSAGNPNGFTISENENSSMRFSVEYKGEEMLLENLPA